MKINSITANSYNTKNQGLNSRNTNKNKFRTPNFSSNERVTNPNLQLLNPTYNQVNINFKGINESSINILKKIPLEDRLASIFQNFKLGDLILVGKSLSECAQQMYKSTGVVQNAIKRGFYIADDKIESNLGFIKNPNGETEVINLNNDKINLISGDKTYPLEPQDSFYVVEGDILENQGKTLTIKSEPKADLSIYRKYFAKTFDYEKEVKENLDKINKQTISQLISKKHHQTTPVTFAEVGGLTELKNALKRDIIYPIQYPEAYENMELNKGFIFYGKPGTGKTHIARALANEAGANFKSLNGLDLESKWVGESEANWRNLFQEAKAEQPTIIFIDEFDAVARSRDSHDEYGNKVVNQLLTLMTDIDNEGDQVYIIGATNNFKSLDTAITRSGRFGKHYEVTPPDYEGLKEIFKVHTKNKPIDETVNVDKMIKDLSDLNATGADIKFIVNEAHNNGYIRAGIFKKMEDKTFTSKDIEEFKIKQEDFDKVLEEFKKDKSTKQIKRNPIGFNK